MEFSKGVVRALAEECMNRLYRPLDGKGALEVQERNTRIVDIVFVV
jgi:hypothetical protein